jgi:hypothetical protein
MILTFIIFISSLFSFDKPNWSLKTAENNIEIINIDDFENYTDTKDFINTWKSRSDNYKETLKSNAYYYYINDKNPKNKYLCTALRMLPSDGYKRKDLSDKDLKQILNETDNVPSVSLYKNYWDTSIPIAKFFHKSGKDVFLEWDWIAYKLPTGADNTVKEKDDNAISIYAVLYPGWMTFRYLKFNWSPMQILGELERFKIHDKKREYILRNAKDPLNKWVHQSVNISELIKSNWPKYYNSSEIIGIAVMSDSDDSKKPSNACIDNIKLVIKPIATESKKSQ